MQDQQKLFVEALKNAKNILVTVGDNPTVDQLAATIGLALALNKLDKHATAVYSGVTPSTLGFLKPEETLEPNTDSLRDFIIAIDKSKADRLRYKVEDNVVRIFITPFHTAISDKDLDFSQGDFNVDLVVALGIQNLEEVDAAVREHGRILHDAVIAILSTVPMQDLGTITWVEEKASSLSEMVLVSLQELAKEVLEPQIATALLTGIVANTERFSNDRTTPVTMNVSAILMAAGADQQLITSELEAPQPATQPIVEESYGADISEPVVATQDENEATVHLEPEVSEPQPDTSNPNVSNPYEQPPADVADAEPLRETDTTSVPDPDSPSNELLDIEKQVQGSTQQDEDEDEGTISLHSASADSLSHDIDHSMEIHVDDNGRFTRVGDPASTEASSGPIASPLAGETAKEVAEPSGAADTIASPESTASAPDQDEPKVAVHRQLLGNSDSGFGGPLSAYGQEQQNNENFDPALENTEDEGEQEEGLHDSAASHHTVIQPPADDASASPDNLDEKYAAAVNAATPVDGIPKPPSAAVEAPVGPVSLPTPTPPQETPFSTLSSLGITGTPTDEKEGGDVPPPPPVPPPMIPPQ